MTTPSYEQASSPAQAAPGRNREAGAPTQNRLREIAESFGADAARYDRTRPSYPSAMVNRIIAASPGPDVLDVGTGTGVAARQFQAAGCAVLGVEPDERMAEFARGTGVAVEVARFEDWDDAGREFDAVIAGTAWHWVDPVAGAAKAARILRPGGRLAPFHHVFQLPPEVAAATAEVYRRVLPDSPFGSAGPRSGSAAELYQPLFGKIADGITAAGAFTEPEQWRFEWDLVRTREEWLDQIPTHGAAATWLPPDQLAEILDGVGAAIDAVGGSITVQYTTVVVTATRHG